MKTAILGPGQASQYIEMGKAFYDQFDEAKKIFQTAEKISNKNITQLCFQGPEKLLTQTDNVQICIATVSAAAYEIIKKETDMEFSACAGHSLGEYVALYAAGVLDLELLLESVTLRGKFMHETAERFEGGMTAIIGAELPIIEETVDSLLRQGIINIANLNSPSQVIISGEMHLLEKASETLKNSGAKKIIPLKVSGPWHSEFMRMAADKLYDFLVKKTIQPPILDVYSNVTAQKYPQSPAEIRELLVEQVYSPLNWVDEINNIKDTGIETFIELAPNKILKGLLRQIDRKLKVINIDNPDQIESLKNL